MTIVFTMRTKICVVEYENVWKPLKHLTLLKNFKHELDKMFPPVFRYTSPHLSQSGTRYRSGAE